MICTNIRIIRITIIPMPAMLMEMITVFHLDIDYLFAHQKKMCVYQT